MYDDTAEVISKQWIFDFLNKDKLKANKNKISPEIKKRQRINYEIQGNSIKIQEET